VRGTALSGGNLKGRRVGELDCQRTELGLGEVAPS
jgi:hypothetical protein